MFLPLKPTAHRRHTLRFAAASIYVILLLWGLLDFSGTGQAWQRLRQSRETNNTVISQLADARMLAQRNRSLLELALQANSPGPAPVAEIEANIDRINTLWSHTLPFVKDSHEGWLTSNVASQRLHYLNDGLLPTLEVMRASEPLASLRPLASRALTLYEPFDTSLANLAHYANTRAEREHAAAQKDLKTALLNFVLLTGLLLLLSRQLATLALRCIPR
jgi:hypothetical protein